MSKRVSKTLYAAVHPKALLKLLEKTNALYAEYLSIGIKLPVLAHHVKGIKAQLAKNYVEPKEEDLAICQSQEQ